MVSTNLAGWEARDQIATDQIEAKRKILEAQGISLDMGFIQKLTKDAASAKQSLINLAAWKTELARLEKERIIIVRRRWAARGRIAIVAFRVRRKIDLGFSLSLTDLNLSLKYRENAFSPDAENLITQAMG
jgi:hypothetical protein